MQHFLVDFSVVFAIFWAQWRIGRMLLSAARQRSARAARPCLMFLAAAGLALVIGYLLGYTEIRALLPFTSPAVGLFSGLSQMWLFSSFCAYVASVAVSLARARITRRMPFDSRRRRLVEAAGGALVASPFVAFGYGVFVERTNFRVREVDVPIAGLDPDLEGLRLLQLTDIHLSPFLSARELARVIGQANETQPHVALITGDLISSHGDPLDDCLRLLGTIRADAGILGCMGNHERYSGAEAYSTDEGARLGIRFLRFAKAPLRFGNATLNFAGIDYQPVSDRRLYLRGADRLLLPGAHNVLLSHNPDVFPVAAAQGYDLTLSGHTHGGQVNVEILRRDINPARFFTPYVHGLYQGTFGGHSAAAYVSRGIGTIGMPARLGAPPEISLLRLRRG